MLISDDASNARGEEGNTSGHFRDDRDTSGYRKPSTKPAMSVICCEICWFELLLYREIQHLTVRVAEHVPDPKHVVLLEVRACCRSALFAASEAMRTFFSSDPYSVSTGQPLNDEALESFRRLSTIVREARDALPSTEARLDELGRLLRIELNSVPVYMSVLMALQRTMGWGSRATLVTDLPAHIRKLVNQLYELEKEITLFHTAFQDSEWARGNYDGTKFIKAFDILEKLKDRDGVILLDTSYTIC
ncbi:hypothetical protein BDZ89DRAFT_1064719 [Hymenopellis radicata]|nr:hypothetical protein BDZ89DRAFT_1064719 [Hymenopellis radicata]